MNKLTKRKRHSIYVKMLKELDNGIADKYDKGFCRILRLLGYNFNNVNSIIRSLDVLYELIKHEPNHDDSVYWFDFDEEGITKRREILLECIEQTKPIGKVNLIKETE